MKALLKRLKFMTVKIMNQIVRHGRKNGNAPKVCGCSRYKFRRCSQKGMMVAFAANVQGLLAAGYYT